MITIPTPDKKFLQDNKSEYSGNIASSFGIDFGGFSGELSGSKPFIPVFTSDDEANLKLVIAFKQYNGTPFAATTLDRVYKKPSTTWVRDTEADTPTTRPESDLEVFDEELIVSTHNDLWKWNGTAWTPNWWTDLGGLNQPAMTVNPHPLQTGFLFHLLLIGDKNNIHVYNSFTGDVYNNRITFPVDNIVQWIKRGKNKYWFGCSVSNKDYGVVYEWNETDEGWTREYPLTSQPLSCVVKNDIPYVVLKNGLVVAFDGSDFTEVARFPSYKRLFKKKSDIITKALLYIHRNGMTLNDNGDIEMLVKFSFESNTNRTNEVCVDGVWCLDGNGLYHKNALGFSNAVPNSLSSQLASHPIGALISSKDCDETYAGYEIENEALSKKFCIGKPDTPSMAHTHFITPKIITQDIESVIDINIKAYSELADNKIIIKHKNSELPHSPHSTSFTGQAIWVDNKTFTVVFNVDDFKEGDEVFIVGGVGSGYSEEIESITESAGTRTVVLKNTIPNVSASNESAVIFSNWKVVEKLEGIGTFNKSFSIGKPSDWHQFKIIMVRKDATINKLKLKELTIKMHKSR